MYGPTAGKTNAQLAQHVSSSREACKTVLLDYFAVGEGAAVDVSHEIIFNNGNLRAAIQCLASWVNVNMDAAGMRLEYEPVIEKLEKDGSESVSGEKRTRKEKAADERILPALLPPHIKPEVMIAGSRSHKNEHRLLLPCSVCEY